MSTAPHPLAPEEIMAHLDGELSPERSQSVAVHLESCASCKELAASLRNTSESLCHWTVAPAPLSASFDRQLSRAAVDRSSEPRHPGEQALFDFLSQRWKLLTASAVVALLLVMIVGSRKSREHTAPGRTQQVALREELAGDKVENQERSVLHSGLASPKSKLASSGAEAIGHGSGYGNGPVSRDVNGLFHGLDDHRESGLSVDGQPITDQQSRVFSGPMISRTVSLSLFTKEFDSSHAALDAILVRHNGYAAGLSVATPQNAARSLEASLRVPAPELPAVLAELKSLGRVEGETQNGEEVTQQHADLVARLKNSRETEHRLEAILTERTGKIKDVLEVEQEMARVRGEIEQMEAEQINLEHRVDFAAINLQLSEEYKAQLEPPAPAISTLIHNATINGYRNVADTLLWAALFFAEYVPVLFFWCLLLAIPAWLVWRRSRHATAAI